MSKALEYIKAALQIAFSLVVLAIVLLNFHGLYVALQRFLERAASVSAIKVLGQPSFTTGIPGSDGAHFTVPRGVAVDPQDRVIVADTGNHKIRLGTPVLITEPAFSPNTSLRPSDGQFQIEVTASINQLVLIQATSALPASDWSTLQTGTLWNGRMTFTDPDASSFSLRFYRAVSPVP